MDLLKGAITLVDWIWFLALAGAAIALGFAFTFIVHQDQLERLDTIATENQQVVSDLTFARQQEADIEELRQQTREIQLIVRDFEDRLPPSREIPRLAENFEQIAGEEEVLVDELRSLPRTRDEKKETIPYQVVVLGNYHQVVSFINRLERFKRYLKIEDVEIRLDKDSALSRASFTLSTYAFIKKPKTGAN